MNPSRDAHPPETRSVAAGRAASPRTATATSVELVRGALGAMWKEHVPHTLSLLLPEPLPQPNAPSPADYTKMGVGVSQVRAHGWHAGGEGLLETLGNESLGTPGVADGQSLLTLLQTVPRAHQDISPRAMTRPASPGPSECPCGRRAWVAWGLGARGQFWE